MGLKDKQITVFASGSDGFIYEIVDRKLMVKFETGGGLQ